MVPKAGFRLERPVQLLWAASGVVAAATSPSPCPIPVRGCFKKMTAAPALVWCLAALLKKLPSLCKHVQGQAQGQKIAEQL